MAEERNLLLFPGKGSSNRVWNVGKRPEHLLVDPAEGDPCTHHRRHSLASAQPQKIPIFPLFPDSGTSVQSPVLPAAPGALLETFPGNLESLVLPAATPHLITEPEHFWPALGHCFRGSGGCFFLILRLIFEPSVAPSDPPPRCNPADCPAFPNSPADNISDRPGPVLQRLQQAAADLILLGIYVTGNEIAFC